MLWLYFEPVKGYIRKMYVLYIVTYYTYNICINAFYHSDAMIKGNSQPAEEGMILLSG